MICWVWEGVTIHRICLKKKTTDRPCFPGWLEKLRSVRTTPGNMWIPTTTLSRRSTVWPRGNVYQGCPVFRPPSQEREKRSEESHDPLGVGSKKRHHFSAHQLCSPPFGWRAGGCGTRNWIGWRRIADSTMWGSLHPCRYWKSGEKKEGKGCQ